MIQYTVSNINVPNSVIYCIICTCLLRIYVHWGERYRNSFTSFPTIFLKVFVVFIPFRQSSVIWINDTGIVTNDRFVRASFVPTGAGRFPLLRCQHLAARWLTALRPFNTILEARTFNVTGIESWAPRRTWKGYKLWQVIEVSPAVMSTGDPTNGSSLHSAMKKVNFKIFPQPKLTKFLPQNRFNLWFFTTQMEERRFHDIKSVENNCSGYAYFRSNYAF